MFLLIPRTYGNVPMSKMLLINKLTVKKSRFLVFTMLGWQYENHGITTGSPDAIGPGYICQP